MIQLEGFKEFTEQVKKLGESQKKTVLAAIMRKNLKPVANAIRVLAPVRNERERTIVRYRKNGTVSTRSEIGNLKRSIGVRSFTQRSGISAYAGIMNGKGVEDEGGNKSRKNDGYYGEFVIRGTSHIKRKNPFIQRAANYTLPAANRNLGKDINEYIIKNGQKLGLDIK